MGIIEAKQYAEGSKRFRNDPRRSSVATSAPLRAAVTRSNSPQ
jgi:hypothetical protein